MKRLLTTAVLLLVLAARARADAPAADVQAVITLALQKALGEQLVPEYALAAKTDTVVVRDSAAFVGEPLRLVAIPAEAMPKLKDLTLERLPMPKIREKAERVGAFVYVTVRKLELNGSEGFATVSTGWIVGKKKKQNYMPMTGGSVRMRMVKREGTWQFDKVVEKTVSDPYGDVMYRDGMRRY
jgi:hypothetical protein